MDAMQTSAWDDFPNFYEITGLEILVSFDTVMTKRKTYDLLSLLSDMGGLFQALTSVFSILISWYANFNTGVFMMQNLFVAYPKIKNVRSD